MVVLWWLFFPCNDYSWFFCLYYCFFFLIFCIFFFFHLYFPLLYFIFSIFVIGVTKACLSVLLYFCFIIVFIMFPRFKNLPILFLFPFIMVSKLLESKIVSRLLKFQTLTVVFKFNILGKLVLPFPHLLFSCFWCWFLFYFPLLLLQFEPFH
jgi:hypothetical protein